MINAGGPDRGRASQSGGSPSLATLLAHTDRAMTLHVGQTASRSMTVGPDEVRTFAELSGDYNPLHFDEGFAAATRFGRLVAQGGLTTGLLHALVAMDMPGPGTVFLSQNWKFTAPVYIGDTITATATVRSVHASKPVCHLGVEIVNQEGVVVLGGEAWCYTMTPAPGA